MGPWGSMASQSMRRSCSAAPAWASWSVGRTSIMLGPLRSTTALPRSRLACSTSLAI